LAIQPVLDFKVAGFALMLFALTILLSTLTPAWRLWRSDLNLKSGINGRNRLFQAVLCGGQIALCTTIVLCAGLILRSLANLRGVDTGLDLDRVTIFAIDPHLAGYDGVRNWASQQRLLDSVRNLPGVEGAALADRALMRGIGLGTAVTFPGQPPEGVINTSSNSVSPGYFAVMGIKLVSGRDFDTENTASNGLTQTIVNQAFVRKFLNGRNPLGEEFSAHGQSAKPTHEIIGVVSDSKYRSLREVPPPTMYTNEFGPKAYPGTFILHVRSRGDPRAVIDPVRQTLRSVDPELPVYHVSTMTEQVDRSLWRERLLAMLTSGFGVFAMALASLGLYGILAYFVARRRREIGLCMALGAERSDIIRMVVRRVIPPFVLGLAAGAVLSWLAGAWIRSLLFGVGPFDAAAGGMALVLLGIIGTLAAVVPTFRAMRIDPALALRQD
jgi:predicted permease